MFRHDCVVATRLSVRRCRQGRKRAPANQHVAEPHEGLPREQIMTAIENFLHVIGGPHVPCPCPYVGEGIVLMTLDAAQTISAIRGNDLLEFKFLRVAGGAVRLGNPFRIKALEEDSFLNSVFAGKAARDLYLSAIHRFGILQQVGEGIEVPIRDREERPLALVRTFQSGGRLVFLPFRMNTTWTDLPLRNSFLPLVMELSFGGLKTPSSRAWPVLEPGETWGPGTRRWSWPWLSSTR